MPNRMKSSHYIDGEKMGRLADEASKSGILDDELIEMFYLLARRTLGQYEAMSEFSFRDPEEAIQEAVMKCFKVIRIFDLSRLENDHNTYHLFRVVVLQTFSRVQTYYNRQIRNPAGGIVSFDELAEADECPYRCLRQEYMGRFISDTPHEDATEWNS